MRPPVTVDKLTDANLPPLPSRPPTIDRSLHGKLAEDEMSTNPLGLDPLPMDSEHPLYHNDDDNDRSKSSTHPTLSDENRQSVHNIHNDSDEDDNDVFVEHSFADAHASLPADCQFTFLYLSSEDSPCDDPSLGIDHDVSLPDSSSTRQGTTHISATAYEVLRSTGDVRRK